MIDPTPEEIAERADVEKAASLKRKAAAKGTNRRMMAGLRRYHGMRIQGKKVWKPA